jgi:hypothetical protein
MFLASKFLKILMYRSINLVLPNFKKILGFFENFNNLVPFPPAKITICITGCLHEKLFS